MTKRLIYTLLSLLTLSISLNLFQYSSVEIVCKNIDSRWKADLLYNMGHNRLDGDKDGVPCENLPYNHDNTVDIINNNTQRSQQFAAQQNLANQTTLITQGFCNTNSSIEKAILAGQQNTAAIISASTANTQKILDKLCADETARLRSELLEARNSQSNSLQTQYLISQLRPYPTPSYQVSSPYESITPTAGA